MHVNRMTWPDRQEKELRVKKTLHKHAKTVYEYPPMDYSRL